MAIYALSLWMAPLILSTKLGLLPSLVAVVVS